MSISSYNGQPINLGDTVYQITSDSEGLRLLEWTVSRINETGTINVSTSKYQDGNRQTVNQNNINPKNVHTNPAELIMIWYENIKKQWESISKLAEPYLTDSDSEI